jgi:hypothetical protein
MLDLLKAPEDIKWGGVGHKPRHGFSMKPYTLYQIVADQKIGEA